jgi:threonine dehydrogenase-like Zn-dependent dehydrogenase
MRALWMERGKLTLVERPVPDRPGDCVVRVTMAGICGTDLHMRRGYADYTGIPGHEFVGTVENVPGPDQRHWLGQRVVGDINVGCGTCGACSRGVTTHCENREVLGIRRRDGAFAEYLTLPASNLHPVPDAVDDRTAVFTEPVAAGCRILEQIDLGPSQTVAVLGDGRMGLLVAQVMATTGAPVVLYGRHDARLDRARSLGLDARLTPAGPLPPAEQFDVIVEVTGRPDGLERALGCVRPLGTIIMKTTAHGTPAMATWPIVVNEVTIVGSRCGPFLPALDLLASGAVRTEPLIEGVFGLEDFDRAFASAEHGLKVLFDCTR